MATSWLSTRRGAAFVIWRRTLLLCAALSLLPAPAFAHAYLVKAVPAQRAVLFAPPDRVQLWFNERLEAAFCTLQVFDAADKPVDKGDMQVAPDDAKHLSVGLNPLGAGAYTVKFRVLSVDGHVVTSQFSFTVRGSR
jgi:methionine-rich copper-binding protein CopC